MDNEYICICCNCGSKNEIDDMRYYVKKQNLQCNICSNTKFWIETKKSIGEN